jgi:hypothetical protein
MIMKIFDSVWYHISLTPTFAFQLRGRGETRGGGGSNIGWGKSSNYSLKMLNFEQNDDLNKIHHYSLTRGTLPATRWHGKS